LSTAITDHVAHADDSANNNISNARSARFISVTSDKQNDGLCEAWIIAPVATIDNYPRRHRNVLMRTRLVPTRITDLGVAGKHTMGASCDWRGGCAARLGSSMSPIEPKRWPFAARACSAV
jgi:hypothetical protein